ncbi:hypothetical protein KAX02_06345 [candidate division WOR-3 bacterium]|nr:hypothetical protein [candidate division WOR-3 bacterium]
MNRRRPVKHDIRMYLKCTKCGNIFSAIKSGIANSWCLNGTNGEKLYLTNCSRCGEVTCRQTTRKAWMKSNEVRPDNAQ